jgi:hypothetical protein
VIDMPTSTELTAHAAVKASATNPNVAETAKAAGAAGKTSVSATSATAAHAGAAGPGSASAPATGAASTGAASGHASGSVSLPGVLKGVVLGLKSSLAVKSMAAVGLAVAGLAVAAHTGVVPAAQGSISLVPAWSSGPSLASQLQAGLSGSGSGGASLHLGL